MNKPIFRRVRGDSPATTPCVVLLVAVDEAVSAAAIDKSVELAAGAPIAVLALLKIHGYSLGLPNPGLMPTAKEKRARRGLVADVLAGIERRGGQGDGQVTATRNPTRAITALAGTRRPLVVVIDRRPASRWRRSLEGDVAAGVRRRLRTRAEVIVIEADPHGLSGCR